MRTIKSAIVVVLIPLLISCGRTETTNPVVEDLPPPPAPKLELKCEPTGTSIEDKAVCLDQRSCSYGDESWFRQHMCFCWDTLCMCFMSKSTQLCDSPLDEQCESKGSILIIGPGMCSLPPEKRDAILFTEGDGK